MPTCSFCKKNYENPRGITIFTFEGKAIHFCSSKCRRNLDLKRDPKKVNWVKRKKKTKTTTITKEEKPKQETKKEPKKEKPVETKEDKPKTETKK